MKIKCEFSGGLELIFNDQAKIEVDMEKKSNMMQLIKTLKEKHMTGQADLFINQKEDSIRPGILILINDSDWELFETVEYELQDGDEIVFISTLHGG
mmetsp:Transcript_9172/g.13571  ORF Transcript_9172/g.13571 Transcript_9172/m.13571 type:complete len:97 (+) Transcript_9172:39-329(+)